MITFHQLGPGDEALLDDLDTDVFDGPLKSTSVSEFLNDPRHHLVVARAGTKVVGMASGFHYVHPDKAPQLFINEVGVSEAYQRQGIGRRLIEMLLERGRALGCSEAWVAAEASNLAALGLYEALGGTLELQPIALYTFPLQ